MRTPDLLGVGHWAAWKTILTGQEKPHTSVGFYLLHCPGAHAFWSYWNMGVIHLRDIPGVAPSKKHFPAATHEFHSFAITPENNYVPDPDKPDGSKWLSPYDLIHQVELPSDQEAQQVLLMMVRKILTGTASPDSDFKSYWKTTLDTTARHIREGLHPLA